MLTQEDLQALQTIQRQARRYRRQARRYRRQACHHRKRHGRSKKSLAEVREATNYLLELVDGKEKAIRKLI